MQKYFGIDMYVYAFISCSDSEYVLNLLTVHNKHSRGWLFVSQSQHLELKFFLFKSGIWKYLKFICLCSCLGCFVSTCTGKFNYLSFHLVFAIHYMHSLGIYHNISNAIQFIVFFLFCIRLSIHKISMHTPPPPQWKFASLIAQPSVFSVWINTR